MFIKQVLRKIYWGLLPEGLEFMAFKNKKDVSRLQAIKRYRLVRGNDKTEAGCNFCNQFDKLVSIIDFDYNSYYIYPYDAWKVRRIQTDSQLAVSITVDNSTVLNSSLTDIKKKVGEGNNEVFKNNELDIVRSIRNLVERIKRQLRNQKTKRAKILTEYFSHMVDNKPNSLDEALQKILFYNALFWQANHWHNGLGRLDLVLEEYYLRDITEGRLTREKARKYIEEFCRILNKNYRQKSLSLLGDTGQYILLGGIDKNGITVQNELTELFLDVIAEIHLPDPKIILRVNDDTSDAVWSKAIDCISTGCGSPLIMNEKLIMEGMKEFGYKPEDVWNVGTSACWEPLIIGKSFDQNNPLPNIPIMKSLNETLFQEVEYDTYEDLLSTFQLLVAQQIAGSIHDVKFDVSPLYSLFFDDCLNREKDFTQGGAVYNYHGVQIVSLPNIVNALLNIKEYIFDREMLTLEECRNALRANYDGYEDIRNLLMNNYKRYGSTSKQVLELTEQLMDFISSEVARYKINNKAIKVGYSSSQYISAKDGVKASLDGRKDNDPFAVHISPVSQKIDIQEVLDFAGSLNYSGNRMNGNVVDFILPSSYIKNKEKLISILKNAMTKGVYELQLNVFDVATLRDAKMHPEKYPNLIVRVWGFSAYFNDLPEEYKNNLIARAELYA